MAGTDTVDVVSLHYVKILEHMVERSCASENGMAIVTVNTFQLYSLTIDICNGILDFKTLETDKETDMLGTACKIEGIKRGILIAPKSGSCNGKRYFSLVVYLRRAALNGLTVGREKLIFNVSLAICTDLSVDISVCKIIVKRDLGIYVGNMNLVTEKQEYLAENTRITEFILIFKIRAITPFEDNHLDSINTLVKKRGHVDLTGHVADLAVSGKLIVNIKIEAGVYTLKIDVDLLIQHILVDEHLTAVKTAGIVCRNVRRVNREGITNVQVVGSIITLAKIALPTAGNHNLAKLLA
jgi:hypothetical protein